MSRCFLKLGCESELQDSCCQRPRSIDHQMPDSFEMRSKKRAKQRRPKTALPVIVWPTPENGNRRLGRATSATVLTPCANTILGAACGRSKLRRVRLSQAQQASEGRGLEELSKLLVCSKTAVPGTGTLRISVPANRGAARRLFGVRPSTAAASFGVRLSQAQQAGKSEALGLFEGGCARDGHTPALKTKDRAAARSCFCNLSPQSDYGLRTR